MHAARESKRSREAGPRGAREGLRLWLAMVHRDTRYDPAVCARADASPRV